VNRLTRFVVRLRQEEFRRFVEYIVIMGMVGAVMAAVVVSFTGHINSVLAAIGSSL